MGKSKRSAGDILREFFEAQREQSMVELRSPTDPGEKFVNGDERKRLDDLRYSALKILEKRKIQAGRKGGEVGSAEVGGGAEFVG